MSEEKVGLTNQHTVPISKRYTKTTLMGVRRRDVIIEWGLDVPANLRIVEELEEGVVRVIVEEAE
jgi:hypothetical protein